MGACGSKANPREDLDPFSGGSRAQSRCYPLAAPSDEVAALAAQRAPLGTPPSLVQTAGFVAAPTSDGMPAADEAGRLAAVRALGVQETAPRPYLESITGLMKQMFQVPVATVMLIEQSDLHFLSPAGDWACRASRPGSFCEWTLVPDSHEVLVVENALEDPRFCNARHVAGEPHIRFYAGAPLISTLQGHLYGTLCVFDFQPRSFASAQCAMLGHFAEMALRELEQEVALSWQQQELRRSSAAAKSLLRAPGGAADFWEMFAAVDGKQAALAAAGAGGDFTLKLHLRQASVPGCSSDGLPSPFQSAGSAPFTLVLRRADGDEPLAGAPAIGIPDFVPGPPEAAGLAGGLLGGGGSDSGSFYFGRLQEDQPLSSLTSGRGSLDSAASRSGSMDGEAGALVPSFLQMRPAVLQEAVLGQLIGTGARCRCYRGTWQGGRVAIKVVECQGGAGAGGAGKSGTAAAELEAVLARSLSHPHILATFCYGVSREEDPRSGRVREQVWIVTELCNSGSLLNGIDRGLPHRNAASGGGPHLPHILAVASEIAGAMAYLHSHDIIHGDLTPSNVLLTSCIKDARRWVCKRSSGAPDQPLRLPSPRPTPARAVSHMPPELLGSGTLSKAADVFSWGILVLEMLHGRRAWLGASAQAVLAWGVAGELPFAIPSPPAVPAELAGLLRRCLSHDPAQRPNFTAVLSEVQQIAHELVRDREREAAASMGPAGDAPPPRTPTRLSAAD
ncbi:hypothetical protein ABPG75_001243 [Micractinium tetrahymenae]